MGTNTHLIIDRRQLLELGAMSVAALGFSGCSAGGGATGIIGAMESEVSLLKDSMDGAKVTTISGMEFTEGKLAGKKVVVVQCGMGKVNAGICAQVLIGSFDVARVINTGVAGSLTQELGINDFVVSVDAVQHDFDVSPIGFKRGEIPYTGMVSFPADAELRALAVEAVKQAAPSSKVLEGRVCTGDQFISTPEQIAEITTNFGGLCCEMEGGAIAQVCHLNEVPYVIIRAISDDSDEGDYAQFEADAAAECAKATIAMVERL